MTTQKTDATDEALDKLDRAVDKVFTYGPSKKTASIGPNLTKEKITKVQARIKDRLIKTKKAE
jgi:2-phospho-L-lactate transferase/gluconeogenesis factor (CofD/UPF0052 family)